MATISEPLNRWLNGKQTDECVDLTTTLQLEADTQSEAAYLQNHGICQVPNFDMCTAFAKMDMWSLPISYWVYF